MGKERVRFEARRHAVVLAPALARAAVLAGLGGALVVLGAPWSLAGTVAAAVGVLLAFRAVWRWERTRVVVTTERLLVVSGTLRRRSAEVALARLGPLEVEQGLAGRLLSYGTVVAGDLEIPYVARPRELGRLLG